MQTVKQTYTTLEMEAALCAWEHMNELDASGSSPIDRLVEENGRVTMRHAAMEVGVIAVAVWDACRTDTFDNISYDMEFVPAVYRSLEPSDVSGAFFKAPDDIMEFAQKVLDDLMAMDNRLIGEPPRPTVAPRHF